MADPRSETLAETIIQHSVRLQERETLLIECFDLEDESLVQQLIRKAEQRGATVLLDLKRLTLVRELLLRATEEMLDCWAAVESARMELVDAYVALRGSRNSSELADVPAERMNLYNERFLKPVHFDRRIKKTRWCVLRLPNYAMAQQARMSFDAFQDFYYSACNVDYGRLGRALQPLAELMERTSEVRIEGPGTDLQFSIAGINVVPCAGEMNIPDGEVFTAPLRESVHGTIRFNTPTLYQGAGFENITLRFEDGRIIDASCESGDRERLKRIFQADEGASFIGEWSLGCNPKIKKPMCDILFDEKIAGSFHLTPGNAYDEADNGNRSRIHWDLVQIQTPEFGGGTITFDGKPIRVDGRFLDPALSPLDPD